MRIARVHQQHDHAGAGDQLMQQLKPLRGQSAAEKAHTGRVPSRTVQSGNKSRLDRIDGGAEDNRNGRGRGLRRKGRRRAGCRNDRHPTPHQSLRQRRRAIVLAVRPLIFDDDVSALDIADVIEALAKRIRKGRIARACPARQPPDHRRGRLRARRERPRSRRAAERD
jgi:hypothetical protein